MARLEGGASVIIGAARGQGRRHAVRLTQEGADMIAVRVREQVETVLCATATSTSKALPVAALEAVDNSDAVLHPVTEDGRHVTGTTHTVDAGGQL